MELFRDYTLTWWQMGLFKIYLASAGIIIGTYFAEYLKDWMNLLIGMFVITLIYFVYALLTKKI